MGNLTNKYIKDTYDGLIKLADESQGVQPTPQKLQDGVGNDLPAQVSSTEFTITGSLVGNADTATSASHAVQADNADTATTASFALTASHAENYADIYVTGLTFVTESTDPNGGELTIHQTEGQPDITVDLDGRYYTIAAAQSENLRLDFIEAATASLEFYTASNGDIRNDFNSYTSSQGVVDTGQNVRLQSLESKTGSYATTGSNVFTGLQQVNNDLVIQGNLYVSGSETIISSSTLIVGDREIELNANRTVGNAGIIVYDVVSPEGTGSLQYDVTNNYWIAGQYGSEEKVILQSDLATAAVESAIRTTITAKNVTASPIQKGTPCFITGSGTSGNLVGVIPADAGNPSLMPAGVVLNETLNPGGEGSAIVVGFINGVDTSLFNEGDSIYVGVGGGYTNVKPTGSANLIQKLGNVEKVDGSNGSGVITGPGRVNDVPNISEGYAWIGNSDGVATPTSTGSFARRDEVNTFSQNQIINGTLQVNDRTDIIGDGVNNSVLNVSETTGTSGSIGFILNNFGSAQPTIFFSGDNSYFQADGNFNIENAPGGIGSGSMTFTTNGNLGLTTNGTGGENISLYANSGNIDLTTAASSQTNINGSLNINAKDGSPFSIASGSMNISVQMSEFGGSTQPEIIFNGDNSFFAANNNFVVSADNSMDIRSNGANATLQSNNNWAQILAGDKIYLSGSNQLNIDTSNVSITDDYPTFQFNAGFGGDRDFINVNEMSGYYSGFPTMSDTKFGIQRNSSYFYNGFVWNMWDSPSQNWGSDLFVSANGVGGNVIASGSGTSADMYIYADTIGRTWGEFNAQYLDFGDANTLDIDIASAGPSSTVTGLYGNNVDVGSPFGYTDDIDIDANNYIRLDSAQVDISGSVNIVNGINVAGAIDAQTTLNVSGVTTLNNNLEITGSINITDGMTAQGVNVFNGLNEIGGGGQLYVNGLFEAGGQSKFVNSLEVTGSLGVSGSMNLIQNKPATGTQANIIDINGQQGYYGGFPFMTQTNFGLQSYSSQQYNGLVTEMWDSPSYNWGVDFAVSANGVFSEVIASGSGNVAELNVYATSAGTTFGSYRAQNIDIGTNSDLATLDLGYIGPNSATTKLAGNLVYVGSNFGYTDEIYIDANNELRLDGNEVNITGSVNIQDTMTLAPQDPLPGGALGELAVSSSNELYFHNGTGWNLIA